MAGCLGLSGLIVCWDDNRISIDGSTEVDAEIPLRFVLMVGMLGY